MVEAMGRPGPFRLCRFVGVQHQYAAAVPRSPARLSVCFRWPENEIGKLLIEVPPRESLSKAADQRQSNPRHLT